MSNLLPSDLIVMLPGIEHLGEVRIDPELRSLLHRPSEDEVRCLEESIIQVGVRDPIRLARINGTDGQVVLDGHTRIEICRRRGIGLETATFEVIEFGAKAEAQRWILQNQLGRRNLTDSQRAMIAARLVTLERGGNQHSSMDECSRAKAAAAVGVSPGSVDRASRVLDCGVPELIAAVEQGELSVRAGAEMAKLDPGKQTRLLAKGPDATKKAPVITKKRKKREKKNTAEGPSTWLIVSGSVEVPIEFKFSVRVPEEEALKAAAEILSTAKGIQGTFRRGLDFDDLLNALVAESVKAGRLTLAVLEDGERDTQRQPHVPEVTS